MVVNEYELIKLIHVRPEVWDSNSVQFRNKNIKNGAWRDIAQMLGTTVEECQVTWKKLRDRYTRIKRMLPSGSEGERKSWDKEELLRFLDKILVTRRTTSSAAESMIMSESSFTSSVEGVNQELEHINKEGQENIHQENIVEFSELNHSRDNAVRIFESETVPAPSPTPPIIVIPPDTNRGNKQDADLLTPKLLPSGSMRRKRNKNKNDCITESLITAINNITESEATQNVIVADVNEAFLRYHSQQARELLSNKNINEQRRIRNRLSACIDELYEEFNE